MGREFFVYEAWLALLGFIFSEPLHLFIANYAILSSLSAILIFIFIGKQRGYDIVTLWIGLIFLISILNYKANPYTHRLALILTLVFLITTNKRKDTFAHWTLACIIGAALLYIRVEYTLAAFVLCFFVIYRMYREYRLKHNKAFFLYAVLLLFLLFCLSLANPIYRGDDRSAAAFQALYTLSEVKTEYIISNLKDIFSGHFSHFYGIQDTYLKWIDPNVEMASFSEKFGKARGVIESFFHNSLAFFDHILRNIFIFWVYVAYTLLPIRGAYFFLVPLLLTFFVLPFYYLRKKGYKAGQFIIKIKDHLLGKPKQALAKLLSKLAFLGPHHSLLFAIFVTAAISLLIFSPHWSYMVFPLGLVIALVGGILPPLDKVLRIPSWALISLYLITVYCIPYRAPYYQQGKIGITPPKSYEPSACSERNKVRHIMSIYHKSSGLQKRSRRQKIIISYFGNPAVYFNEYQDIFAFVGPLASKNEFAKRVQKHNISIIDVSSRLLGIYHRREEKSSFESFMRKPENYGFYKYHIKGCRDFFLVRK